MVGGEYGAQVSVDMCDRRAEARIELQVSIHAVLIAVKGRGGYMRTILRNST